MSAGSSKEATRLDLCLHSLELQTQSDSGTTADMGTSTTPDATTAPIARVVMPLLLISLLFQIGLSNLGQGKGFIHFFYNCSSGWAYSASGELERWIPTSRRGMRVFPIPPYSSSRTCVLEKSEALSWSQVSSRARRFFS